MQLITAEIRAVLIANSQRFQGNPDLDPHSVVKLITPDAAATRLVASAELEDPDVLFGLCDPGPGCRRLAPFSSRGSVLFAADASAARRTHFAFKAERPNSAYATRLAMAARAIVV